MNISSHC